VYARLIAVTETSPMRMLTLAAITALAAFPALAADPAAGERVFKTQCGACHSPLAGKNLVGPSLFGIAGRHSGSIEGFRYSAANKSANLTWDDATLDTYLTNPRAMVVGTTMTYVGLKNDAQRADLIAYLGTLK
jgi:cytochrome c